MVRFSFYGDVIADVPDEIEKYVKTYWLKDMVELKTPAIDKTIKTVVIDKFELKSKYPMVALGDIVALNPSKSEIRNISDDTLVSFVEMASVSNEGYISTKVDRPLGELKSGSYTYFAENDLIFAKITPCMENGKCAIAEGLTNGIALGSSEFHVFRCSDKIASRYLFALLNTPLIRNAAAMNMTGASGHRRVPESFYSNLNVPLPPLFIQQQIVDECKKVDEEFNTSRMTIETYRKKITSIFHDLEVIKSGGVIINKLGDIVKLSSGKMLSNKNRLDGAIPVYGGNGITGYHNEALVHEPTIVIGRVGEYCGSVHLTDNEAWITDNALYVTRYLFDIDKKFLLYMLKEINLNQFANRAGQPNISQASIANVEVPCPTLEEQKSIISEVESYEQIISEASRIMESCISRKQAILDKYLK